MERRAKSGRLHQSVPNGVGGVWQSPKQAQGQIEEKGQMEESLHGFSGMSPFTRAPQSLSDRGGQIVTVFAEKEIGSEQVFPLEPRSPDRHIDLILR
jgi:hypothetical protein